MRARVRTATLFRMETFVFLSGGVQAVNAFGSEVTPKKQSITYPKPSCM